MNTQEIVRELKAEIDRLQIAVAALDGANTTDSRHCCSVMPCPQVDESPQASSWSRESSERYLPTRPVLLARIARHVLAEWFKANYRALERERSN